MKYFSHGMIKIASFWVLAASITLLMMRASPVLFPPIPEPSAAVDCDDSTLQMYNHYQSLGIESRPIIGNLEMTGEAYMECDHVWLLVKSGNKEIAYDWGVPRFDKQHYEGYEISLEKLITAVNNDLEGADYVAAAE